MKKKNLLTLAAAAMMTLGLASCSGLTAGLGNLVGEIKDETILKNLNEEPNLLGAISSASSALSSSDVIIAPSIEEPAVSGPVGPSIENPSSSIVTPSIPTPEPSAPTTSNPSTVVPPSIIVPPTSVVPPSTEVPEIPEVPEETEEEKLIKKYASIATSLIEAPVKIQIKESDRLDYKVRIDYSLPQTDASFKTYAIYYNQIGDNSAIKTPEEVLAELQNSKKNIKQESLIQMDGIVVDGQVEYRFTGIQEQFIVNTNVKTTVTAYVRIDEANFARLIQTDKNNKSEFSYELYQQGVKTQEIEIETKTSGNKKEVEFTIENADGTFREVEISSKTKGSKTYLVIEDESLTADKFTALEIWIKSSVNADGKIVYEYHTEEVEISWNQGGDVATPDVDDKDEDDYEDDYEDEDEDDDDDHHHGGHHGGHHGQYGDFDDKWNDHHFDHSWFDNWKK